MEKKGKQKVHVITMGCPKNQVDSEKLMAQLRLSDIELAASIEDADIAVINTCGFIAAAKEESIDAILEQVRLKARGNLKKVYAMGCLTERYRNELRKEIPEVDGFFGSHQPQDVVNALGGTLKYELLGERVLTEPSHVAYMKVSEGCDNPCSFCAIPRMRGTHASRPLEEIVAEARLLAAKGVRELVLIGQDTTCYGLDLYGRRSIADVLERVADIEGIAWVRLMYAYPAKFPQELLNVIGRHPRVCKYLDMPIQHIADPVLRSMRRGISGRALRDLLVTIRDQVPEIALRTTLIVGYPGETAREFEELLEFVGSFRFDRLGVFTYSPEEGTHAYSLGDPVQQEEKERRQELIMEAQKEISLERNSALIDTRQKVIVDRLEGDRYAGRTERDAPEIDNEVLFSSGRALHPGEFTEVHIVDASEYDLYGRT